MISIITASHNSSLFIGETINSVINQSYTNWELIIVDDSSKDDSVEVIQSFTHQDSRIKLICLERNSGAAVARNRALSEASGRYIAFLDSDDCWVPRKLEKQLNFMRQNNFPFTFTAYNKMNECGQVFERVCIPERVNYFDLLKVCSIGCLTAMYDSEYFGKVFMPHIRKRQDLGLWLKLLKKVDYAYGLDEVLASYRVRPNSISANKLNAASYTWRLYREHENLSFLMAAYFFSHYAIRGLIRTKLPSLAKSLSSLR